MSIVKDPAKRFQSAAAFGAAIASIGGRVPPVAATRPPQATLAAAAAVAPPPPAPAPAQPRGASSRRGLYMALGAVLLVLVLGAGAIVIPKWLRTRAGESPASAQQEAPSATPAENPQSPPAMPEQPPAQVSAPAASQTPETRRAPGVVQPAAAKTGAGQAQPASRPQTQQSEQPAFRQPLQTQAQAPAQQPPAAQPAAQAPAVDAAKVAALREVQKSWPMLASRAGAVASTLQNLEQAQKRSGFGLRGDISASWKRMEHYMDQADAAISAKDPALAKENMESAEREIQTLEKFLGR
jgi:hypothetical protein